MEYLLLHYGYAFLVIGLILEGDATLVAAMILASQAGERYFDMRWVLGLALGVTVVGNELIYELGALGWMRGRLEGQNASRRHFQTAARWLHGTRGGYLALLFSRFLWGFRLMIPFAAGLLHIRRRRFSLSNLIGAVMWVAVLAYFGVAIQSLLVLLHEDLVRYQMHLAAGLFLLGMLVGLASIPWQIMRLGAHRRAAGMAAARAARAANATIVATAKATARSFPSPRLHNLNVNVNPEPPAAGNSLEHPQVP